ncbi:hypothetical protein C8F01DRAFT_1075425 [Mycena amicta]|nr:hypothetical protein C8F01DRAFT_1075425 [Mycena amicta]
MTTTLAVDHYLLFRPKAHLHQRKLGVRPEGVNVAHTSDSQRREIIETVNKTWDQGIQQGMHYSTLKAGLGLFQVKKDYKLLVSEIYGEKSQNPRPKSGFSERNLRKPRLQSGFFGPHPTGSSRVTVTINTVTPPSTLGHAPGAVLLVRQQQRRRRLLLLLGAIPQYPSPRRSNRTVARQELNGPPSGNKYFHPPLLHSFFMDAHSSRESTRFGAWSLRETTSSVSRVGVKRKVPGAVMNVVAALLQATDESDGCGEYAVFSTWLSPLVSRDPQVKPGPIYGTIEGHIKNATAAVDVKSAKMTSPPQRLSAGFQPACGPMQLRTFTGASRRLPRALSFPRSASGRLEPTGIARFDSPGPQPQTKSANVSEESIKTSAASGECDEREGEPVAANAVVSDSVCSGVSWQRDRTAGLELGIGANECENISARSVRLGVASHGARSPPSSSGSAPQETKHEDEVPLGGSESKVTARARECRCQDTVMAAAMRIAAFPHSDIYPSSATSIAAGANGVWRENNNMVTFSYVLRIEWGGFCASRSNFTNQDMQKSYLNRGRTSYHENAKNHPNPEALRRSHNSCFIWMLYHSLEGIDRGCIAPSESPPSRFHPHVWWTIQGALILMVRFIDPNMAKMRDLRHLGYILPDDPRACQNGNANARECRQ